MQCPNCGNTVKPESKFCPRCAFNLRQAAAPPASSAPERQPDSLEKKWEQAAQQYGQQAARQPEQPAAAARKPEPVEAATAQSCPQCRAAVKPGQKFCMNCAAPLAEGGLQQPAMPAAMQGQPQPMPGYPAQAQDWGAQQPYPQPQTAGSSKMIIAIAVGVLVLAGAGVGAYFLFFNKGAAAGNTNSQTTQSAAASNSNTSVQSNTNTRPTTTTTTTTSGTGLPGVVNALLQAMKDGDTSALRSNIARNASANADAILNDIRAKGTMTSYKLTTEPTAFEDRGVAFFTFDFSGGAQSTGLMNLVKEDGTWKLDSFAMF